MLSGNSRPAISVPALAQVSGFPADWMATSACVHIVAFIILLLIPEIPVIRDAPASTRATLETPISLIKSNDPPLLASIQSSSSSSRAAAASTDAAPAHSVGSGSSSVMPVVFKGAQHIVSDTPDPDNAVQTILQPDVQNPPRIHAPIPVPSIVKIAAPQRPPSLSAPKLSTEVHVAAPPTPAPAATPPLPLIQHAEVNTVPLTSQTTLADAPRLPVFATLGRSYTAPKQPPPPPSPPSPTASAPVLAAAWPSPEPPAATAKSNIGQDAHNLLVANAVDVQSMQSRELLAEVEIHGRFEVSPNPRLAGVGASSPPSAKAVAAGSGSGAGRGDGTSHAKGSGSTAGAGAGSGGHTAHAGSSGSGKGEATEGGGLAKGTSGGSGHAASGTSGQGGASGNANGAGPGSGNGNQPSPFMGMTITGGVHSGSGGGMSIAGAHNVNPPKHDHGSYGMTIISSGGSGGGLRDFGVFSDGPVYTVYIDVSSLGIQGTRWSLQYGPSREVRLAHPGVLLSPPFPQTQKLPHLPPALVASNMGRLLVVQATLTPEGTLDSMRILETPDERLNEPLMASLTHWTFQPASMGTDKVPVKVLLGVPIAALMATEPDTTQQADQPLRDNPTHITAQ